MAWQRVLEAYLVQALLRTPAFHRAVEKVAKNVHRIRYGIPPEEMGGTKIDDPSNSSNSFLKHFSEEVQTQLGRAEGKGSGDVDVRKGVGGKVEGGVEVEEDQSADAVWKTARKNVEEGQRDKEKQGFMGEYVAALREQLRGGK